MATIDIKADNLNETIEKNDVVLIELFAPWCGHCRQYTPVFKKVSDEVEGVVFGLVNCDENKSISKNLGIAGVPTTIGYKGGKEVTRKAGGMSEEKLGEFIEEVKSAE